MSGFTIGINALRTALQRMNVAGHNIANVHTPGYHSRKANQIPVHGGGGGAQFDGMGVDISYISRARDVLIDEGLLRHRQEAGYYSQLERIIRHVETMINEPSDSAMSERLSDLFSTMQRWAGEPDDPTLQQAVINKADAVSGMFNHMDRELVYLRDNLFSAAEDTINEINRLTRSIASLNEDIKSTYAAGRSAAGLEDERDQMIHNLAELVNFSTHETAEGVKSINSGGVMLVSDVTNNELTVVEQDGVLRIFAGDRIKNEIAVPGGRLGGISTAHKEIITKYMDSLDELANGLRRQLNLIHTTGLVQGGRFTELEGGNPFTSEESMVHELGYDVPEGQDFLLIINVEDAHGNITPHELEIDTDQSARDFLDDIIDRINDINGVKAIDNEGRLRIEADPDNGGYAFGFATPFNPFPDPSTSTELKPEIFGEFTGNENLRYTVSFGGDGTVGEDNLQMQIEVEDPQGNTRTFTRTVDENYVPGTAIHIEQGLRLSLEGVPVEEGEEIQFAAYATMDEAGILDALGINTFLSGQGAAGLGVSRRLKEEPAMFATSMRPVTGDNKNLLKIADLNEERLMSRGTATFHEYYNNLVTDVGAMHQSIQNTLRSEEDLVKELSNQRESVIGVNMEEQLVEIMQSKNLYQGAMRYITVVTGYFDELAALI